MADDEWIISRYFTNRRLRREEEEKLIKQIQESDCEDYFKINMKGLGYGTLTTVGVAAAAKGWLAGLGFGSLGPTAGSIASAAQTATTVSGSWFAICQSVGMIGLKTIIWPAAATGAAVYAGYTGVKYYKKRKCVKLYEQAKQKGLLSKWKKYW